MSKKTVNYLTVFITVVLAIAFIVAIAELTQTRTAITQKTQTIDISSARTAGGNLNSSKEFTVNTGWDTWRSEYSECIAQTITFKNSTGATMADPTDYVYVYNANGGQLTLKNVTALNNSISNTTTATYDYCPEGYVASGWGRTILNTNVGLFAIAILIVGIALVYYLLKREGEDD